MTAVHQIIGRVVLYGLLATIVVAAFPYGSVQPWWTALFECVIFILAILAIIDLLITKDKLPTGTAIAVPLVLLSIFLVIQSLPLFATNDSIIPGLRLSISADPFATQLLAVKLLALILAGVLLLRYANTERRLRTVVYVVLGIGVASALFGLLRQGTGGSNWFFPLPQPERGFAQFVNRNHFGFLMEMTFGLALGLAMRSARGYQRWLLFLPIAAFLWISLVIANSRGAIFASLCQVLFLVIVMDPIGHFAAREPQQLSTPLNRIGRWTGRIVVAMILVVVFLVGVNWVGGERVTSNIELTSTAYDQPDLDPRQNARRKQIWLATWKMFKAHPIVGTGLGAYWIAITKYHDASGELTPQEAHNDYLELLASGGLVSTVLVLWFVARLANRGRTSARKTATSGIVLGALVGIAGVTIHSFVDFGLHITANALIFTVLLTLLNAPFQSAALAPKADAELI